MAIGRLVLTRFTQTYSEISELVHDLTPEFAATPALPGANPVYWIIGHIVVARTNVLALLGQPSLWSWDTIKRFIPDSQPTPETAYHISFHQLQHDFDQTQSQLESVLTSLSDDDLVRSHDERLVIDYLLEYAAHEAYHTGQLSILVPSSISKSY